MMIKSTKLLLALLFISIVSLKAQQNIDHEEHEHIDPFYLPLTFDKDSLKGFNEKAAWQQARINSAKLWQQERFVAVLKRDYINFKFGLVQPAAPDPSIQQLCTNPGFENGTLSGWAAVQSNNNSSSTMLPWNPLATTQTNIMNTGSTEANGLPITPIPPGGGNYSLRLGPTGATNGGRSYRVSQTFTVDPNSTVFVYKYAVALNKSAPHVCNEQPFFNVSFKDCNGNPIPCGQYDVAAIGSGCSTGGDPSFVSFNNTWSYKPWTTAAFDLSAYIGQCVKLEFTVGGCIISQAGHGAYAYIDADCKPFTLNLNTVDIPPGQTSSSICGSVGTNTLCAPPGFGYNWNGPGVNGQTGQCVNPSAVGTYSVVLTIPGTSCAFSPTLTTTFNATPSPTVAAAITQPICINPVGTATMTAVSGTAPYTYSWSPAAPSNSVNTNLPAGTPYTVTVTDANGCKGITSFSINPYPPAPSYTLSVSPSYSLTCLSPSTTITFTNTNSNTNASWTNPAGAAISQSVLVVTSPGVYTYTAINTVSTCSLTGSINITSNIVLPVVLVNISQPSCTLATGSATVTATGGVTTGNPYVYNWLPNTVGTPNFESNENLPPGSSYTVSVTDNLGCTGVKTFSVNNFSGAAQFTVTPFTNTLLTCTNPSVNISIGSSNANTSVTLFGPGGLIIPTNTIVTNAGVYTYTAINAQSTCSVVGTINVTSDKVIPTATYSSVCNSDSIGVKAESSLSDVTLNWLTPDSPPKSLGFQGYSTAVGVFTLTVTNPNNGCTQTYTLTTVRPTVTVTTAPSNNILTCNTKTIQATAVSSITGTNVVVTWFNGVSTVTVNPYNITAPGNYTTTVQVINGCPSSATVAVTSNTIANVSINPSSTLITCATGSVSLNASSNVGGPYTYVWVPSAPSFTGTTFIVTDANNYSVVALNTANGCTATATQVITEEVVVASFDASIYMGEAPLPVTFTNTSVNPTGTTYSWDFGNGTGSTTTPTVSTIYPTKGEYWVILTAQNGTCRDTAARRIKVDLISLFEVPNVFTPNGDGYNDVFTLKAINMGEITLTIFDRWGLKMHESTDIGNVKWDGKNKGGASVTDGTYFYIIKAVGLDDKIYDLKGTVNVFR